MQLCSASEKEKKNCLFFLYKIYHNKHTAWVGWCLLSGFYCIFCYFDFKTFDKVRGISLLNWKDCFSLFPTFIHYFFNVENTLLLHFCFEILISFVYLKSNFFVKNVKNFFYFFLIFTYSCNFIDTRTSCILRNWCYDADIDNWPDLINKKRSHIKNYYLYFLITN